MTQSPGLVWAAPPAPLWWPEHARFSPPSGPRRTRTGVEHGPAEGVPHSRLMLFPAPKRHGTDQFIAWSASSSHDSAPRARAPPQEAAGGTSDAWTVIATGWRVAAPHYTEGLSTQPRLQASQRQQGANASNTRNKAPAPARSSQDPLSEHEVSRRRATRRRLL